jgi:hypothetical protein
MLWPNAFAATRIFDRLIDDGFVRLEARGRAPQPLLLELHHLVSKAVALLANTIPLRHAHVVEENLRGVGRAHAHLVEFSRHFDAFSSFRDAPLGAGPGSILPAGVMDSGLARFTRAPE